MKNCYIPFMLLVFSLASSSMFAQDYYEDMNGDGSPILKGTDGSLLGARYNVKDNSIKINFFTFLKSRYSSFKDESKKPVLTDGMVLPSLPIEPTIQDKVKKWGIGIGIKAKTEQNIGSLFSAGAFAPGIQGSGYAIHRTIIRKKDGQDAKGEMKYSTIRTFLFSASYSASTYRLYDNTLPFDRMKIDSSYNGYSFSISYFINKPVGKLYSDEERKIYEGRPNNLIFGVSGELSLKNNYSKLQQYEVKDYLVQVVDAGTGTTRVVQIADDEGYGYSKNNYKEYINFKIRPHVNFIPGVLSHRIGMIFYPSYDIVEKSKPRVNFGLGLHLLEKDHPAISKVGIYFEFNDVANGAAVKDKTFIQRSFSIGIGAAFNMFTGKQ